MQWLGLQRLRRPLRSGADGVAEGAVSLPTRSDVHRLPDQPLRAQSPTWRSPESRLPAIEFPSFGSLAHRV
jgi:hypothetical protein